MHKAWSTIEEVPYCFWRSSIKVQGHTGWKIDYLNPIWVRLLRRSQLSNPSDLPCLNSTLAGYGTKPKLTLYSRIRKLSSKNAGIFRYNPLSIKAAIPYTLLACQNHRHSGVAYGRHKKSVATASRSRWRHSMRQTSSVWGPVFVLYCVLNFISHRDKWSWRCWTVFHKETIGDVM